MPRDPLVARCHAALPELVASPEWAQQTVWYRRHEFDIEDMDLMSLSHGVLGPCLSRLLDEHDVLVRLLAVVEELLASDDRGARATSEHLVEYRLFRPGRDGGVAPLVGPATIRVLAGLHETWVPWRGLPAVLEPFMREVVAQVQAAHPTLSGVPSITVDLGATRFSMYAGFMYDPAGQRFEDLLVYFSVGSNDVATFELSRGSGVLLAPEFPQLVLSGDPGEPSFDVALREYVDAAMAFTWEHLPGILPELTEPYDREEV